MGLTKSLENAKEITSILAAPAIIPNGKGPTRDEIRSRLLENCPHFSTRPPPRNPRRSQAPSRTLWESRENIRPR